MRLLTNFPYSPFGRSAGSTQRFLQIILGLRELGHEITLWSFKNPSGYQWADADLEAAAGYGIKVVLTPRGEPFESSTLDGIDFVWGVYFHYLRYYNDFNGPKICDTHDILTPNFQIDEYFENYLSKEGDIFAFDRDIFEKEPIHTEFPIREEELEVYRKTHAVMISLREQERLAQKKIKSTYIPFIPPIAGQSNHSGKPIYLASAHLNNIYGNDLLGIKLLPKMRLRAPIEFNVVGELKDVCRQFPAIAYQGYTETNEELLTAPFGISPLFYGTGFQLKVLTYMAHGVPPIIFKPRSELPLEHNVNCLVAETYDDFCDYCVELWNDIELCKKLGKAAQETVRNYYTHEQMLVDLEKVIKDHLNA